MMDEFNLDANTKTISFAFDGVIHSATSAWVAPEVIPDPPIKGIGEVLRRCKEDGFEVAVDTARAQTYQGYKAVINYLVKHGLIEYVDYVVKAKPIAKFYIDTRAVEFKGNTDALIERIEGGRK